MNKEEYIEVREELKKGELSDKGLQFIYEMYKELGGDREYGEFVNGFTKWINLPQIVMQGNRILEKICKFGDSKYSITTLSNREGQILKIY